MSTQSINSFISHGGNNGGVFNEMKQKLGLNISTNFTFTKRGPDHMPIFQCSSMVVLKHGGNDYEIKEQAEGQNKKGAKDNCVGLINKRILEIVQPASAPIFPLASTSFMEKVHKTPGIHVSADNQQQPYAPIFPLPPTGFIEKVHETPPIQVSVDSQQQPYVSPKQKAVLRVQQPIGPPSPANKFTSPGIYFTPPDNKGHLGSGGFGRVFCVVKKGDEGKLLALKVPKFEDNDVYRQKFEKELELHTKAQENDFVAKIVGTAYVQKRRALVMEYCSRGSLAQLISHETVAPSLICRIHREIAKAIRYLHGTVDEIKRITHNDLKPDNVLLTDDFRARLCDFGGSNIATQTFLRSSTVREIESAAYTVYFMSPERDRFPNNMPTKVSDIYSFGVCLYSSLIKVTYERDVRFYKRFKTHRREVTRPIRDRLYDLEHEKVNERSGDNKAEAEILYELLQLIHYCCIEKVNERPNIEDVFGKIELCYRENEAGKYAFKIEEYLASRYPKKYFKFDKDVWVNIDQLKL